MPTIIEQLIPLAVKHQKADEYIAGTYWNGTSGCSWCADIVCKEVAA